MNVSRMNDAARASQTHAHTRTNAQENHKKDTTLAADNTDKLEPTKTAAYSNTYTKGANKSEYAGVGKEGVRGAGRTSARQMKNEAVTNMVASQINKQVNKGGYKPLFGGNETVMNALQAAEASSEKHEDYWSADATAERIFTFAKTLAGGDDEMFETLKDAFLKGFQQAEGAWSEAGGGKLPGISYETKDKVLEMFDAWESEIKAKGETAKVEAKTEETKAETKDSKTSYIGADKYGSTGATSAPSKYSGGEKVSYMGPEKYGKSFTEEDYASKGYVAPQA